jgi:hypothetical protein
MIDFVDESDSYAKQQSQSSANADLYGRIGEPDIVGSNRSK